MGPTTCVSIAYCSPTTNLITSVACVSAAYFVCRTPIRLAWPIEAIVAAWRASVVRLFPKEGTTSRVAYIGIMWYTG